MSQFLFSPSIPDVWTLKNSLGNLCPSKNGLVLFIIDFVPVRFDLGLYGKTERYFSKPSATTSSCIDKPDSTLPCSFNIHISTLRRLYCTINSIGVERNREKENTSRHIILQKGLQISIQPTAQNTKTPPPHNLQYRVQLIEDVLGF